MTLLFAAQTTIDNSSKTIQASTANQAQGQQLQQVQQLQQQASIAANTPMVANNQQQPVLPPVNDPNTGSAPAALPVPQANGLAPSIGNAQQPQVPQQLPSPQSAVAPAAQDVASGTVSEEELNNAAFKSVAQNALPMTPEQIQRLRQLFNQTQYAATATPGTPPRPATTSEFVNLAPGSTPPVIRLQQGFVTSLVFVDSTGAPWPVEAYDIGNPSAFNIQWNKTDNIFMIQATTLYTYGNLAVKLQGLATPVMLTLISGQKAVDYRRELRIPGFGPNAKPTPTGNGLPSSANPVLLGVLDGVPPAGSTALKVSGGGCEVWLSGDHMYVRTHYTVLSPAWLATMSSADGTKAYEMPKAPLLLVSQNGKVVQLKIEGL